MFENTFRKATNVYTFFNIGYGDIILGLLALVCFLHPFAFYPKKDLRMERISSMKWMTLKELPRYVTVIENLFLKDRISSEKNWPGFRRVIGPVIKMWKLSGITFTITYWSEVLRLVVCYVDERNRFVPSDSVWVKTHRGKRSLTSFAGLPQCLPIRIKALCLRVKQGITSGSLSRGDLILFKLLLSVLSFFRATSPEWAEVKKSTITDPFTGTNMTLPAKSIERALKSMGWNGKANSLFKFKPTIFQFSQKAGPNASLAILGIGIDLLGWMLRPNSYMQYCLMAYRRGYWMLLNTFVLSSVLLLPVAIILYFLGNKPWLGRIAVLHEARGKRRLIGITDWWTQVLLRPLHDDIYAFLGRIPQDGTNDQSRPITDMLSALGVKCSVKSGGKRLQSMDLSAATDRLPVVLQEQILNILGFEGTLWKNVLEREWDLHGETVRYAVGQPMGAYSSFASLALTHHVIVRVASIQAGVDPKHLLYAVLGDDGALAHEKVAKYYKAIFLQLGMKINPIKGFDGTVLEFAKQLWTINGYNISPLGAKNILLFMRNVEFLPSLLFELTVKRFPFFKLLKKDKRLLNFGNTKFKNYRNWKRSADGSRTLAFTNFTQLESLVSKLFFQKRVRKDGRWITVNTDPSQTSSERLTRIRIRVLMAIGPRSGLWYLDKRSYSWMTGSHFEGWWRTQFTAAASLWGFWKKPPFAILSWVKRDQEPTFWDAIRSLKKELLSLSTVLGVLVRVPWTYVPNWVDWNSGVYTETRPRSDRAIVHPFVNLVYSYIALTVPILPNLFVKFLKQLYKVITGVLYITWWRILEYHRVQTLHPYDLLEISWCLSTVLFLLVDDLYIWFLTIIPIWLYYNLIGWSGFKDWVRDRISDIRGHSYWPPYDPRAGPVSTLEKVADKVKLEDSGAYKELIRMCSGSAPVRKYLSNRATSEAKSKKVVIASSGRSKRGSVITVPTTRVKEEI